MEQNSNGKTFLFLGVFFVAAGTLLNQWTIGYFRPNPRPIVELKNLVIIWTFQIISVGIGLIFVIFRNKLTEARLIKYYKNISAVVTTLIVGFVLMNVVLYSASVLRLSLSGANSKAQEKGISQKDIYPGFSDAQIAEILKESWSRSFLYEPFTMFKEGSYHGTYVNVDENGFRHVKDQEPWPPKKTNFNVFIFGNSTVFNYSVPDDETIASYIQEKLRAAAPEKKVAVYNFGRGFFYSSQERALYDKLLVAGYVPNVALFIDGQQEFGHPHDIPQFTQNLESFFNRVSSYLVIFDNLPVTDWVRSLMAARSNPQESTAAHYIPTKEELADVEDGLQRYLANKKLIEMSSLAFDVKPFFVWQPIAAYKYDKNFDPSVIVTDGPGAPLGYPRMAKYVTGHFMGNDFLYLADMQENVKRPIYVDGTHYSGEFSSEVASRIADFLKRNVF